MTENAKPNVVLVLTDDQGYGDLGCMGNPWLKTPNLDAFHGESARFTDFHVSPLCTPTRGALLTGRRPLVHGAWGVFSGRSLLKQTETTMADIFAANGYRTGLFGKWHLGDNYPYRPHDRGFQHVIAHKGGGVGQTPDYWGNNLFDDTYFRNGEPEKVEGYCTDVWFDEALSFINESGEEPFLAVIATNAPHVPHVVEERYAAPYRDNDEIPFPDFCGMIANIDENFGNFRTALAQRGIADNTILMFMTDNGSASGMLLDADGFVRQGYNAGMRGRKGNYYDGGHRVPFFVRWPDGGIGGGADIDVLSCHIDLLPTLVDLCGLDVSPELAFDGRSLQRLLRGEATDVSDDRVEILHIGGQGGGLPAKWKNAVLTSRWRLVHGTELYDIREDPGQRNDVAAQHPDVVQRLRAHHEAWWDSVSPGLEPYARIPLGSNAANPVKLDAFDVLGDAGVHQIDLVRAKRTTGAWAVVVEQAGTYRIALRRWPAELDVPIQESISDEDAGQMAPYGGAVTTCTDMMLVEARLTLFDTEAQAEIQPSDTEIVFEVDVARPGETILDAWFTTADGARQGAYYVYVEKTERGGVGP